MELLGNMVTMEVALAATSAGELADWAPALTEMSRDLSLELLLRCLGASDKKKCIWLMADPQLNEILLQNMFSSQRE